MLDAKLKQYKHTHGKDMSCSAIAQMLSSTLYYRRFFPYYTYNMVAGVDNEGKGGSHNSQSDVVKPSPP